MAAVLMRRGRHTNIEGKGCVTVEAEIGVYSCKPRSTKNCQQLPKARERQGKIISWSFQGGNGPATHLDFGLCWFSDCKEINFVVLSHLVCGTLLEQFLETNTGSLRCPDIQSCIYFL